MVDKYIAEKNRLEEYLKKCGISYNKKTKRWRCPNHHDEHESGYLYKNNDGHIFFCPVCEGNWNIFAICSIINNIPDDKEHFPELLKNIEDKLGICNIKQQNEKQKTEKKNLFHFQQMKNKKKYLIKKLKNLR